MAISKSFTASAVSATDATTCAFSSQALGAAASDRYVLVGIAGRAAAARTISTVTIGGISATELVDFEAASSNAGFYIANVPTGTTGDVVVTFSAGMARAAIGVWRLDGLDSATPADSGSSSAEPAANNLTIPADGAGFAVSFLGGTATHTVTWTGLDLDASYLDTASWEANGRVSFASKTYGTLQTELAVSADWSAANTPAAAFVSFTPTAGGGGGSKPWHYFAQMRQMGV